MEYQKPILSQATDAENLVLGSVFEGDDSPPNGSGNTKPLGVLGLDD